MTDINEIKDIENIVFHDTDEEKEKDINRDICIDIIQKLNKKFYILPFIDVDIKTQIKIIIEIVSNNENDIIMPILSSPFNNYVESICKNSIKIPEFTNILLNQLHGQGKTSSIEKFTINLPDYVYIFNRKDLKKIILGHDEKKFEWTTKNDIERYFTKQYNKEFIKHQNKHQNDKKPIGRKLSYVELSKFIETLDH